MLPVVGLTLNYLHPLRTLGCVESLLQNGLQHVLIWDNSEDGGVSAQILQEHYAERTEVTVVESQRNLGFAAGVNRGIEWIRLNFPAARVLLINNDAQLLPGGALELNDAADGNPQACVIYPVIDHAGVTLGTVYYHRLSGLLFGKSAWGTFSFASGCCQLIVPQRYGGAFFDERFFMYGEDFEQGWRLGPGGLHLVPRMLVTHEGSASSGMATEFYERRMVVGHLLLAHRIARGKADLCLMLLGRAIALSLRAVVRGVRYRSAQPLKGLWFGMVEAFNLISLRD